ncbi:MAG: putative TPR domain [Planctomycetota bacterium]|nr:MAG: putative TPR domain [Planctomycetota bacterium]
MREFRGSWSGYERDFLFFNTDGPSPTLPNAGYVCGLDFDDDGRAAAPADFDGDGDLDLVILSLQGLRAVENTAPPRRYLRLRLEGENGQAAALGALVKVVAGGVSQQDYARLTDGFATQVPFDLHFGLGEAMLADRVEVTWPGGETQTILDVPANRLVTIRRGKNGFDARELPRWPEGSRRRARPEFSFDAAATKLDGGRGPLAAKGLPAVINFWSPSCAPCKEELPRLAALSERFRDAAQFAGVSVETRDLDAVRATATSFALPYPVFIADEALLKSFFGPEANAPLPSTFVFDGNGALRRIFRRTVGEKELGDLLASFGDEGTGALELDRRGARAHYLGNDVEALEWMKKALAVDPDSALATYHMGLVLLALNRPDESLAYIRRAVVLDPEYWNGWYNLGAALHNKGDFKGAAEAYRNARRLRPDDWVILLRLGNSAGKAGEAALALECFDRAVTLQPRNANAWGMKGEFHFVLGQFPAAKDCFAKALAIDPNEPNARAYGKEIEKIERGGK